MGRPKGAAEVVEPSGRKIFIVGPGRGAQGLQDVLKEAVTGDVIRLSKGRYKDHLFIDKPLTLIGMSGAVLDGGGSGNVIKVHSSSVTIRDLTIENGGANLENRDSGIFTDQNFSGIKITNNVVKNCGFGIWINGSASVEVSGNHVEGCRDLSVAKRGNGIQLWNVKHGKVIGNEVEGARDGIFVDLTVDSVIEKNLIHDLRYGIHYMFSDRNTVANNETRGITVGMAIMYGSELEIAGNRSYDNLEHGAMIFTVRDSNIHDNVASNNRKGMFIYDSQYNRIERNLIVENDIGVHIWAGSVENELSGNSLINNRSQLKYVAAEDQEWSDNRRGNYWSDYIGWDTDNDGVGDIPHVGNTLTERLTYTYPVAKLLLNSPAVQVLRTIESEFPVVRPPGVVDNYPLMRPVQSDWSEWLGRSDIKARGTEQTVLHD